MDDLIRISMTVTHVMVPFLSLIVLFRCVRSMLAGRADPETWGYLVSPEGKVQPLLHWECIIGRARSSDVQLPFRDIASVHAVLTRNDKGEWTAHNLSRKGGIYINDERVEHTAPLLDGDLLRCSSHTLQFAANTELHRALQEQRRSVAGWRVAPGATLFFLTLIQILLVLEFSVSKEAEHLLSISLAFAGLILLEWLCYLLIRSMDRSGFEPETIAFFLCTLGLSVCATATPKELTFQIILVITGVTMFFLFGWWLRDLSHVKALRWPMGLLALAFLALNLFAGRVEYGARNWLSIGGFSLQPSEFIKIAFIYVGATTLERMFRSKSILFFIAFSAICVGGLALMGDMGAALVFFAKFLVIAFMRSGSFATVLLAVTSAVMAGTLVLSVKPYVAQRFQTWGHV